MKDNDNMKKYLNILKIRFYQLSIIQNLMNSEDYIFFLMRSMPFNYIIFLI